MDLRANTFLQDLRCDIQYNLKHKLNCENSWKLVADYCNIKDEYGLIAASCNSGEALFNELRAQNFTVAELCEALKHCHLLHILALFEEPAPLQIEARPQVLCDAKYSDNGIGYKIFIEEGQELKLKAVARGVPAPNYEWHCDNGLICSNWTGLLKIEKFEKKNEGTYWCKISQEQGSSDVSEITKDVLVTSKRSDQDRPRVAAKRALLIANQSYDIDDLLAPASDTDKLRDVLKDIYDFDVTVQNDLTGVGMRNAVKKFWENVPENSYVIFYFAGHGFHISNDLFFMGIDKVEPKDFCFEHAMSHEEVIHEGSGRNPSLLFMLCDTCQSQLQDDKYVAINRQCPPKYTYLPYPDVIQGYATSRNGEAYEEVAEGAVADKRANRGLFTKHLIKVLKYGTDLCVSEILAKVRKGVNKEANKYGDIKLQVPMEVTSAVRTHRLSDPILSLGSDPIQSDLIGCRNKRKKMKAKTESTKNATGV